MISESRLQQSLTYLAETDEPAAKAKGLMEGLKNQEKSILAAAFLETDGTVAEREARSRVSPDFTKWRETYENAVLMYETVKNKRNTEATVIEVWRSLNASRRVGNL